MEGTDLVRTADYQGGLKYFIYIVLWKEKTQLCFCNVQSIYLNRIKKDEILVHNANI